MFLQGRPATTNGWLRTLPLSKRDRRMKSFMASSKLVGIEDFRIIAINGYWKPILRRLRRPVNIVCSFRGWERHLLFSSAKTSPAPLPERLLWAFIINGAERGMKCPTRD